MLTTGWDFEKEKQVLREEAYQKAYEEGYKIGFKEGYERGITETGQELGLSYDETLKILLKLMKRYYIIEEKEAREIMDKYWEQ